MAEQVKRSLCTRSVTASEKLKAMKVLLDSKGGVGFDNAAIPVIHVKYIQKWHVTTK